MEKYFRNFLTATTLSRALGYARDLCIAHFVGGGPMADVYFAAFRLANFFRKFVGEGGLYAGYTPVYSSLLAADKDNAKKFALAYGNILLLALSIIVIIAVLFTKPIVWLCVPGFRDLPDSMALAIKSTKILFPFLLFIAMAAWNQATIQSHGKFFLSSLAPMCASIAIIAYLFITNVTGPDLLIGLAMATTLGGLLQWVFLRPQTAKVLEIPFSLIPPKESTLSHPDLKKSFLLLGPYAFTFALEQVNSFIDTFFGSIAGSGAITALYNSSHLIQLPLGLIGVGTLVTSLPTFSKMVTRNDKAALLEAFAKKRKFILMTIVPACLLFMLAASPIVNLLYYHGKFSHDAFLLTSMTLTAMAPSLLFYSLQKLYLTLFYANKDTKGPMTASAIQLTVNIVGCSLIVGHLGAVGIALISSLGSLVGLLSLAAIAAKKEYLKL
ncbi:murein biosynthesis integral membrane protein MurJ [Elusimicrobiota bacterium]